jgi:hypothetical protein
MRAILSILVLVFCSPLAFAADVPPADVPPADPTGAAWQSSENRTYGTALMRLSPMHIEVQDTLARLDAREKQLLVDLAAATDDATVAAIVREFESLPVERTLSVLRIQARYARQENRPDLERVIRLRMLELQVAGNI